MATFTSLQQDMINRLRSKVGDNPTIIVGNNDVQPDPTKQIWADAENFAELESARKIMFKGTRGAMDVLGEYEQEIVILQAASSMMYTLAIDAARYAKYQLQDVNIQRLAPDEFLRIAQAFGSRVKALVDESNDPDAGPTVQVGIIRRYSRYDDLVLPAKNDSLPETVPFTVEQSGASIIINIGHAMISWYREHLLKKITPNVSETIIGDWYTLAEQSIVDTDVVDGVTYTYRLIILDINGNRRELDKSITYAAA